MNPTLKRQTTISDIARLADVSSTTVSRYLNERFEYMSVGTREKIRAAIEQTNYVPNNFARSLKSQKSTSIAVVIPLSTQHSTTLLRGICDECSKNSYATVIYDTDSKIDTESAVLAQCVSEKVAGILLFPSNSDFTGYEQIYSRTGTPIVLFNRYLPSWQHDAVYVDHYKLTTQALQALWEQGYRRILMLTDDTSRLSSKANRNKAFLDFSFEHGFLNPSEIFAAVAPDGHDVAAPIDAFMQHFQGERCALFTVGLPLCIQIIHHLQKKNLKIGEDIGLAAYDSKGYSRLISDKIIQVDQPVRELGNIATRLLLARIKGTAPAAPVVQTLEGRIIY